MGQVHESVFLRDSVQEGPIFLHTNADGLSRITYEPVETPTVTDNLTGDNFVNAMYLRMSERDYYCWMIQLANENRKDYRLGMKLQNYTMLLYYTIIVPL